MQRKSASQIAVALVVAWALTGRSTGEVRLSGTQDHVEIQTNDATIEEILAELRTALDLEVTLKGTTTRRFTGVYSGPVRQVVTYLLDGDDYVLRTTSASLSIILLGKSASEARPGPPPPPPRPTRLPM